MSDYRLVLLRHGESTWNDAGLFTGWVDVGLSTKGEAEAVLTGELLEQHRLLPDVVHTSVLWRAIRTTELDNRLQPVHAVDPAFGVSGTYLDPDAAAASISAVRTQGKASMPSSGRDARPAVPV